MWWKETVFFFNYLLVINESLQCFTRFVVSEEDLTPGKKSLSHSELL